MRNECNIIGDLLPLYTEGLASEDTVTYVQEHLSGCARCAERYEAMKNPDALEPGEVTLREGERVALRKIKKKLRLRRVWTAVAAVCLTIVVLFAASWLVPVSVDYGDSNVYTNEDMDAAIQIITDEVGSWDGCKLYTIRYAGDELCEEELDYCNSLADDGEQYTQCIAFRTDFRSPLRGGGAWSANRLYQWTWYLARTDQGPWQLLTWGAP